MVIQNYIFWQVKALHSIQTHHQLWLRGYEEMAVVRKGIRQVVGDMRTFCAIMEASTSEHLQESTPTELINDLDSLCEILQDAYSDGFPAMFFMSNVGEALDTAIETMRKFGWPVRATDSVLNSDFGYIDARDILEGQCFADNPHYGIGAVTEIEQDILASAVSNLLYQHGMIGSGEKWVKVNRCTLPVEPTTPIDSGLIFCSDVNMVPLMMVYWREDSTDDESDGVREMSLGGGGRSR